MNAGRRTPKTIDEYITGFSSETRDILERIRATENSLTYAWRRTCRLVTQMISLSTSRT
jgi:hypothetical protein